MVRGLAPVMRGIRPRLRQMMNVHALPSTLSAYPPQFLRENTDEMFDPMTMQRNVANEMPIGSIDLKVLRAEPQEDGRVLLEFSDGHVGHLRPPAPVPLLADVPRILWGTGVEPSSVQKELGEGGMLRFRYADLLQRGAEAVRWVRAVHTHGIAVIDGAPEGDERAALLLGEEVFGYVEKSLYGDFSAIKVVAGTDDIANMNCELELHTDQPYLAKPPGILLLHCVAPAPEGGVNRFQDGFDAALALKRDDPDAYRVLTEEPALYTDRKVNWYLSGWHLSVNEDEQGQLQRVVFNGRRRDSWAQAAQGYVASEAFYRAMIKYSEYVSKREHNVGLKLRGGEIACMDNHRILHSRTAFTGFRHMATVAIDWADAVEPFWIARQKRSAGPPGSPGA